MRFRLGIRLGIIFGIFFAELFLFSVIFFRVMDEYENYSTELQEEVEELELVRNFQVAIVSILMPANDFLILGGDEDEPGNFRQLALETEETIKNLDKLKFDYPEEEELFGHLKNHYAKIKALSLRIFTFPDARNNKVAGALMEEMDGVGKEAVIEAEQLHQAVRSEIDIYEIKLKEVRESLNKVLLGGVLFNIVFVLGCLIYFRRSVYLPIASLHKAALQLGQGNLDARVQTKDKSEIGELAKSFNEMAEKVLERTKALAKTNVELEDEIAERKRIEEKLINYQSELRSLASELSLAEERQRRRIATDLHDQISQLLALSMIKIQTLRESADDVDLKDFDEICEMLGRTIQDVRTLTFDLSSPTLYKFGLETAVEELLDDQLREAHGIDCEFTDDKLPKPLDDDIRVLLYQSVRELLINIIKHAHAKKVVVNIQKIDKNMQITITDDGIGFDLSKVKPLTSRGGGFGLFNIKERLDYVGGDMEIDSKPGNGSRFILTTPLKEGTHLSEGNSDGS
ncbi:MAG: sensor histidine kinase [Planctomycetes bacterium]|nr:sensor histidine kinase [Planctomycetota bacterium]